MAIIRKLTKGLTTRKEASEYHTPLVGQLLLKSNSNENEIYTKIQKNHLQNLTFKESLAIKNRKPSLNNGIKATEELCLSNQKNWDTYSAKWRQV